MKTIRKIISRAKIGSLRIPENFGPKVEIVVFPSATSDGNNKTDKSKNFSKLFGIWKDSDISLESIRRNAWR